MQRRWVLWVGIIVVIFGVSLLLGEFFHFNTCAFLFPLALIGLGVWLVLRPHMPKKGGPTYTKVLGEVIRSGKWQVEPQEIWLGIGDVILDFSEALVPVGDTPITIYSFVGDLKCLVPEGIGLKIICASFISDINLFGEKETAVLTPLESQTDDFDRSKRKITLRVNQFIISAKIKRPK